MSSNGLGEGVALLLGIYQAIDMPMLSCERRYTLTQDRSVTLGDTSALSECAHNGKSSASQSRVLRKLSPPFSFAHVKLRYLCTGHREKHNQ